MTVIKFLDNLPAERMALIRALHELIVARDPTIVPLIKPMMGKDMILYEDAGYMKYGLADTKKYMSFHCMPLYLSTELHAKYTALLPLAKFQKGCINFNDEAAMPPLIATALIEECALVNVAMLLSNRLKKPAAKP